MKISIPTNRPARPRPCTPSVNLTNEAYDALYELSVKIDGEFTNSTEVLDGYKTLLGL